MRILITKTIEKHHGIAATLFEDLRGMGAQLPSMQVLDKVLDSIWIGGSANITPLGAR